MDAGTGEAVQDKTDRRTTDLTSQTFTEVHRMASAEFRVESDHPIAGRLLPQPGAQQYFFSDRALAVAMAAKSFTQPSDEIRVVHVPTGEVVFRKAPAPALRGEWTDEP
jgi:hypothetical protein